MSSPTLGPQSLSEGFSFDEDGYLLNTTDWTSELALLLAAQENLKLTTLHWEIITYVREFYLAHQDMPKMRNLITDLRKKSERTEITSSGIHQLFPLGPALQIAKLAGLPKPKRCL